MSASTFALGLDFGTGSVRALIVDTHTGEEAAVGTADYPTGDHGVITDPGNLELARQHPDDWTHGLVQATQEALRRAHGHRDFANDRLIGIGVDATGSTPLPVDRTNTPLASRDDFRHDLAAQAWLWKDHTAHAEASEITAQAQHRGLPYLHKCGGTYSSEWLWSKVLHCERHHPHVAMSAFAWLEACDWIPSWLCGQHEPGKVVRSICAAAHKAMYHPAWGGLPDPAFLRELHPGLVRVRERFHGPALASNQRAGTLRRDLASALGLPELPIAVGLLDAHAGAVGSGCAPGTLVKILGTSTCDCMVLPMDRALPDIPGVCGIAPESIVPGMWGIEAGQSAVGDIFQWFVHKIAPRSVPEGEAAHAALSEAAARLLPGASGLLALDWHNGNRCVLVDPRLTGLVLGLTLATTPAELYRAWIEATAFGARTILDRLAESDVGIDRIVTCGGVAEKNPLLMQIYADVCERPLLAARSPQACALGAAIFGAVVGGAHPDVLTAQRAMTSVKPTTWTPQPAAVAVYRRLHAAYRLVHDAFGTAGARDLSGVMKDLLALRDAQRQA
ncbi:MAG: ribulokinase [Planctomycetes bacterium]|nr:ribulokinase [Planctomycetota bacterium]